MPAGETREREDELKSAGRELFELVAKLIEERGVDAVRETLRAVSAQGDGGGEQTGAWPHTERGGEAVSDPRKEREWGAWWPAPKQVRRQLDEKAKRRYAAHRRIRTARKNAEKARQAQAVLKALPLPKEKVEAAARQTAKWEAKVESRLQEQKKELSKQSRVGAPTSRSFGWRGKAGRRALGRTLTGTNGKKRRQARVSRAKSSRSKQRRRTRTDQQGRGAMRELHCHCRRSRWRRRRCGGTQERVRAAETTGGQR